MTPEQIAQARGAFESHYQSDADDPYVSDMLEIWMAAWERCVWQVGKPAISPAPGSDQ